MAWLGGWKKRIKITIDSAVVDAGLTWFPVPLYLSASSGSGSDDVTAIFDELQSDDNRKKIAVTKSDGTTQLYVEIEKWDDANEKAWLWVSRDGWTVASGSDTEIYIYYDSSHADNTAYVADSGSRTEVWDSSFAGVWHLCDDFLDSTSNDNDGTNSGSADIVAKIADGQDFERGDPDYIEVDGAAQSGSTHTFECWIKAESANDYQTALSNCDSADNTPYATLSYAAGDNFRFRVDSPAAEVTAAVSIATWYHMAGTQNGDTVELFKDGASQGTDTGTGTCSITAEKATIGAFYRDSVGGYSSHFDGTIDEVRISTIVRPDAWIKASYNAGNDSLIKDYAAEEIGFRPHLMCY